MVIKKIVDKKVSESKVETVHLVRPADLNSAGRLFGGTLLSWIDETAGLVAMRHAQMPVVTASVDHLTFVRGVYPGEILIICGKVTYVGTTSMEVKVDSYVEKEGGMRILINRAYLTLVGLDDMDRPTKLPRLILETEEDQKEWDAGQTRKNVRKSQKIMGFKLY